MIPRVLPLALCAILVAAAVAPVVAADVTAPPAAAPEKLDLPVRKVHKTGHVSNYDEAKVGTYTLPDPLVLANGQPVRDATTWNQQRRPEILELYNREIWGRVPATAPQARVEVAASGDPVLNGAAIRKHAIIHFGPDVNGPKADVVLYVPARHDTPVPVLLQVVFLRGLPSEAPEAPLPPAVAKAAKSGRPFSETGPVEEILRRGYGYATFRYGDVQPDDKTSDAHGVEALARKPGETQRAPEEWGAVSAWSWAASRVLDYLTTDHDVDAKRVAIIGHSRLGKTALWAGASDPRFALVFASCSGEMGAALSRRDYGESVDDMAANFPWWFAPNFQKYAGHWNELPVDAHMLIALSAPRPVFISGGSNDQWADPKGEFLAAVAAGPVYRLLGKKDLGTTELPPLDQPLIEGDLGWIYHRGPHAILPQDWTAFLDFADRHLK